MFAIVGVFFLFLGLIVVGLIHARTGGAITGMILRLVANRYAPDAVDARELAALRAKEKARARR